MNKASLPIAFLSGPAGKALAAIGGAVVGLILWVSFFVLPQQKALAGLHSRLEKVHQDVITTKQKVARSPALQAEINRLTAQEPMMAGSSPEEQLPELFKVIAQAAKGAQVHLLNVKAKKEIGQLTPGADGFLQLPVQVDASAGYHQLGQFIDAIESSNSFVQVREMKIRSNPDDIWHHQASFILVIYLFPGGERSKQG